MKIGFHEVGDDVDIVEACLCVGFGDVDEGDDILMVKKF